MSHLPHALWLTVSPQLKRFDQRLLCCLSKRVSVMRWEYIQTEDEPCSLDVAINLLYDYLQGHFAHTHKSVHLIGHGLSGIVGWLYAQQYPEHVKSLTLLSVGANPAVNWHAHYYALRQLLPCSREVVLAQMVRILFGPRSHGITRSLVHMLAQDLDTGLALHSLLDRQSVKPARVKVPLLVCQGGHDAVVDGATQWQPWLKSSDRIWTCPEGHHFFHFDQPRQVETAVLNHWRQVDQLMPVSMTPTLLNLSS
ncbi:MAG: alpha/beta hydrolase [Cyanobacteria bacterium P01_D01_bin.156]